MPIRKPAAKSKEVPEKKKEPVRPVVTQIVEVVEIIEEKEVTAQPAPVEPKNEKPKEEVKPSPQEETPSENEEVAPPDEVKNEESVRNEEEKKAEKKAEEKVVISDLFQKKDTLGIPEISMHKSHSSRTMIVWSTAVITVAVLLGGALMVSSKGMNFSDLPFAISKPTPTPTATPSPTPTQANRKDISIQVLNGGGVIGAATKMKVFLEEKGYTIDDTGNTDEYSYEKTVVLVKLGKEAYATLLRGDLADDYALEASSEALPSDSTYDAQVIVGKK